MTVEIGVGGGWLTLVGPGVASEQRRLDEAAVEQIRGFAETYRALLGKREAQAQLLVLGRQLYDWLDGEEHWSRSYPKGLATGSSGSGRWSMPPSLSSGPGGMFASYSHFDRKTGPARARLPAGQPGTNVPAAPSGPSPRIIVGDDWVNIGGVVLRRRKPTSQAPRKT